MVPGAVAPIKPVVPGVPPAPVLPARPAAGLVAPPPPGGTPLKPVSTSPANLSAPNLKTGTTIVKSAPPKETARITVKPNLPAAPVRASNLAVAKPAGAVPAAAVAAVPAAATTAVVAEAGGPKPAGKPVAAGKPATTIVKAAGAGKVAVAKASAMPVVAAVPVAQYQEESSSMLTTILAGALAVLTWGTAGVLIASYLALI